ncbi:MAG: hypothetical protein M3488_04305 [Actinomycetota bacterium]|nr:hypothetical protein [Actinomycetota bacterium]
MTGPNQVDIRSKSGSVSRFFMGFVILGANLLFGLRGLDVGSRVLIDTDGHMRYNRVLELVTGLNPWWDGWAHRANAPFGHSMHWTRPLDAFLIALSAPVAAFSGWREGLYFAALAVGPLLHVALGLAVAWTARSLLGTSASYLAGMGVAAQSGILSYSAPGRPDHHILIVVIAVLLIGAAIRLSIAPEKSWVTLGALAGAAGLWVSTEFLAPLALTLAFLAWLAFTGKNHLDRFGLWLGGGIGVALLLERPPAEYLAVEYDRISIVHVVLAVLVGLVGLLLRRARGRGSKLALLVTGGVGSVVVLTLWFPLFFAGPFAQVPQSVVDLWLVRVAELAPLWEAASHRWSDASLLIGTGVIGFVLGILRLRRESNRPAWVFLLACLAVFLAFSMRSVRFSVYPSVLGAIAIAGWAAAWIAKMPGRGLSPSLRRVFAMSVVVVGMAYPFLIAIALEGSATAVAQPTCQLDDIVAPLAAELGATNGTVVLASLDSGPELLYRLPIEVVADPYHRNVEGILDSYAALGTGGTGLLDKHNVEYVLVCEHDPDRGVYAAGGLYYQLIAGRAGPEFTEVALGSDSPFRLYRWQAG